MRAGAIRLADLAEGRDNNFNLIRFFAASAVVVFHCYALTNHWTDEPLWKLAPELNLGSVGVKAFFFVSGFLVTKSYLQRRNPLAFAAARALRIYPALVCATLVTIALAAWSSARPVADFLTDRQTTDFAWRVATGFDVRDRLPGAYASNPFPDSVNGSLWTLPVELRLYVALGIAGVAGILARRIVWLVVVIAVAAFFYARPDAFPLASYGAPTLELCVIFALGSLAYVWRDWIALSLFGALAALVMIAWNPGGVFRGALFGPLLAYVLLVIAYHPRLAWPAFHRIGDYSYGLYVFAFPIQQTLARLVPKVEPSTMLAFAFPSTLLLAVISWHFIEKPALGLKSRFDRTNPRLVTP